MFHKALWIPLGVVLLAGSAEARPHGKDGPGRGGPDKDGPGRDGVCREDRQRLCRDAGGKFDAHACMLAHKAELSAPCREKIEKAEGLKADCKADAEKYCSEVPPGRGRLMACLTGRKTDLQPACRKHVDDAIARFMERREKREKRENDKAGGKDKPGPR